MPGVTLVHAFQQQWAGAQMNVVMLGQQVPPTGQVCARMRVRVQVK
jgi:hypothetical protein